MAERFWAFECSFVVNNNDAIPGSKPHPFDPNERFKKDLELPRV